MIDASFSIGLFGLVTSIYFLAKYFLVDRHTDPNSMWKQVLGFHGVLGWALGGVAGRIP